MYIPEHERREGKVNEVEPHNEGVGVGEDVAILQDETVGKGNYRHDQHGEQEPRPEVQTTLQAHDVQRLKVQTNTMVLKRAIVFF